MQESSVLCLRHTHFIRFNGDLDYAQRILFFFNYLMLSISMLCGSVFTVTRSIERWSISQPKIVANQQKMDFSICCTEWRKSTQGGVALLVAAEKSKNPRQQHELAQERRTRQLHTRSSPHELNWGRETQSRRAVSVRLEPESYQKWWIYNYSLNWNLVK